MDLGDIWSKHKTAVRAFLRARVSDADEVDDLMQIILIKTHQNLHTVKSKSHVKLWLMRITNNAIIDFYRKKKRGREFHTVDILPGTPKDDPRKTLARCIVPLINALPQETAKILTAVDIHGRSQKEYAKALGIPYSTLKSRVQKGRRLLRDLFLECCHFSFDRHGRIVDFESKESNCEFC